MAVRLGPRQQGGDDAAVLTRRGQIGPGAARDEDVAEHPENILVRTVIAELLIARMLFARAHGRTDVTARTFAHAAIVERRAFLRRLLGLAVDVLDDVMGTGQHASTALTAGARIDDVVHHVLEGIME